MNKTTQATPHKSGNNANRKPFHPGSRHSPKSAVKPVDNEPLRAFNIAYYQHGGYCIEINPSAHICSIIFSMRVRAKNDVDAFNAFIDEGIKRQHIPAATAARYRALVRRNVASIRIN